MEAQPEASKETKPSQDLLNFCARCFASDDGGSWGVGTIDGHCFNCGAGWTGEIKLPRWAIESIRAQASWVGRRYYPGQEDKENHAELRALRSLPKTFPGRTAELRTDKEKGEFWWVTQSLGEGKTVSQSARGSSAEEAIENTRYTLPYVPALS